MLDRGFCSVVGKRKLLPSKLSRKLMHIGVGPLYMLCWPLYNSSRASPLICASVPLAASLHFYLVGKGVINDQSLIAGTTRSGDRRELLHGPLQYGIIHAAATLLFWRNSPVGITALSILCGGDGLAEVIGSSVRSKKLPYNSDKSVAGTAACFLGGLAFSVPLLLYYQQLGLLTAPASLPALNISRLLAGAALCSAVGAAVESAPLRNLDNVAVTVAVAAAARAYFGF
ncbi:hypothetical protein N2152v2_008707 [Parachlorella kessleri]